MCLIVGVVAASAAATVLAYVWWLRRRRPAATVDATRDPVTGLYDPQVLDRVVAEAVGAARPLTAVVVDLGPVTVLTDPHRAAVLGEVGRQVARVDGVTHVLRTGDTQVTALVAADLRRATATGVTIVQLVGQYPVRLPDGRPVAVWARCGIATYRPGDHPAGLLERARTAGIPRPSSDGSWRCWFDAADLVALADHSTVAADHQRSNLEHATGARCPGGIEIVAHGGLVTAVSTGWPPLLADLGDPALVRTAYPVHTDPPPCPGRGRPVLAHIHLDLVALGAIHRAADWGGLLAVTVRGEQATFTLTRPTHPTGGQHG